MHVACHCGDGTRVSVIARDVIDMNVAAKKRRRTASGKVRFPYLWI